ncbi:MAG: hypothetical protein QQW96_03935 [Tychonema bourrellyi B0820]|nr:hypothetical protein [Tychonema bourrellyi B0820]PJE45211.1 MAG: hypothetical protein CUR32_01015 [Flavobacterium sp.] [Flavobacterium sp. FEMGT703F]
MEGINIWSGCDIGIGAALTNPTQRSFRKNKIKNHYPVTFRNVVFPDAESAYEEYKTNDLQQDIETMTEIIVCKLNQHPRLLEGITQRGGVEWLKRCRHIVGVKNSRWEGQGMESNFILCLIYACQLCT